MQDTPAPPRDKPDPNQPDGYDEIEASKAPLMDHLIELRQRPLYALTGVGLGFIGCSAFAERIYTIQVWPYVWAQSNDKVKMIFTAPQEFFFTKLKLALFAAVFLAFPLIAYQIYMFVAPGLYKNERQAFRPFLVAAFLLFLLGALIVYFIVMPMMMRFFLGTEITEGAVQVELQARVSEYLSLIMTLILGFGIMFQLPVVLTLLARAGIIAGQQLRDFRRYAIVAITGVAAMLSPPDPFSMIAMALPTILLYEAAILAVDHVEKRRARNPETPAAAA
jgi:sec-independent protein translocase protein TatC